jgi:hypothetical protein
MSNTKKLKKYSIFVVGLFFMSLGVALVTKSNLGTSPISSVPYVLSMISPLTIGQFTFLLSLLFIIFANSNHYIENIADKPNSFADKIRLSSKNQSKIKYDQLLMRF